MSQAEPYVITRIRLVGFHNIINETIELPNGGHLFLLGDNGCGKTTILDAVHYVLTAGESMEFNSAARVAGSRTEGRRVQGIVMRYNMETGGPLNKTGGVTYAAIELRGRHGRPTTVGVGLSCGAMDEAVQRWGIIREKTLEEVPFLIEELAGIRPRNYREMRDALAGSSGFYQIGAYKKELARRMFGGDESFREVCRFLSTGKAYREIVSRTSDYHSLFRSLLQEPEPEVFERVIESLRSLNACHEDLENLSRKMHYLHSLQELIDERREHRVDAARYQWLNQHIITKQLRTRQAKLEDARAKIEQQASELDQRVHEAGVQRHHLQQQHDDLKASDSAGLVRQEQDVQTELDSRKQEQQQADILLKQTRSELRKQDRQLRDTRETLLKSTRNLHQALSKLGTRLPFPIADFINAFDAACRAEPVEDAILALDPVPTRNLAEQHHDVLRKQQYELDVRITEQHTEITELTQQLDQLQQQKEAVPDIPGFRDARQRILDGMYRARAIYEGLEVRPGISEDVLSSLEQAIGDEILGTWLPPEGEDDHIRAIILTDFPEQRVATRCEEHELPEWIRQNFDIAKSDPDALLCLSREMITHHGPVTGKWNEKNLIEFRAHVECAAGRPPRLLGQQARREAQKRRIAEARKTLKEREKALALLERQLKQFNEEGEQLNALRELATSRLQALEHEAYATCNTRADQQRASERNAHALSAMQRVTEEVKHLGRRITRLLERISEEGLDKLEQRIKRAGAQLKKAEKQQGDLQLERGRLSHGLEANTTEGVACQNDLARANARLEQSSAYLSTLVPEVANIVHYVLKTRQGDRFRTVESVTTALEKSRTSEARCHGRLMEMVKDPVEGAVYSFVYDEPANQLTARRGLTIAIVAERLERDIGEQQQVINEKTTELFRKIILSELVTALLAKVRRLEDMTRRINKRLEKRLFGSSYYKLQVTPVDRYKNLLRVIRNYNPFDTENTSRELQSFFEDHQQELLDSEINEVPEILDYRNWFHYDLRVTREGSEGVVMDRKTKSVGSGGEQAVPNYLLILMIAHFLYVNEDIRVHTLLFDEAFYGIDAGRRDQLLGFASELGLQIFVASPDQDGVKKDIAYSTSLLVVKDASFEVHLYPFHWDNPENRPQLDLFAADANTEKTIEFGDELGT